MDCEHSKARMNNAEGDDRLSMLPDDLVHKILSFMGIKHAIQTTTALSSRWRFLWTSLPYINISSDDFYNLRDLSNFVNHVLSRRNGQIELYSVNLSFDHTVSEPLLKTILDYAFSHNLQKLTVTCSFRGKIDFPLHLFRSHCLKYLSLTGSEISCSVKYNITLASTWELPALTTLHLDHVAFSDYSIFSKCANLKNLTLSRFTILLESHNFTICHPQLSDLTLKDGYSKVRVVNVVAPLLENLTIRNCYGEHLIAAPNLASLLYNGSCLLHFSSDLCFLEKVDLCIYPADKLSGCNIADLLQQIHGVKFLSLNLEFVKPLISYMEQISLQSSPFFNLKGLKIYPVYVPPDDEAYKKVNLSTKVINYLLDGSPSATFTLISYEEIKERQQKAQALANAVEAESLMARFQVRLEMEKANIKSNRKHMNRWKARMLRHEADANSLDPDMAPVQKMQVHLKRKLKLMKKCCEVVSLQMIHETENPRGIVSQLRDIEIVLLKDLPVSKRDELRASFSSLCAEVDTVVKKLLHPMSIPNIHFNELAETSLLSS